MLRAHAILLHFQQDVDGLISRTRDARRQRLPRAQQDIAATHLRAGRNSLFAWAFLNSAAGPSAPERPCWFTPLLSGRATHTGTRRRPATWCWPFPANRHWTCGRLFETFAYGRAGCFQRDQTMRTAALERIRRTHLTYLRCTSPPLPNACQAFRAFPHKHLCWYRGCLLLIADKISRTYSIFKPPSSPTLLCCMLPLKRPTCRRAISSPQIGGRSAYSIDGGDRRHNSTSHLQNVETYRDDGALCGQRDANVLA